MGKLDGKVALISGSARGQGAAEARLFAQEGAKVVLCDILDDQGQQVEAEINELGGDAHYIHLDVTNESEWESAVAATISKYGKLDILVNNAAIVIQKSAIEDRTADEWGPHLRGQRKGRLPRHEACHPRNAKGRRRLHRQHILSRRYRPEPAPGTGLRSQQGRSPHIQQGNRIPARR